MWGLRQEAKEDPDGSSPALAGDIDHMGVRIESFEESFTDYEQTIFRSAAQRTGKHDAPSEPGDLDLTLYSLRKFVRLALKGNPTILTLLFVPLSHQICGDSRGQGLQEMSSHIVSRRAGGAFLGYLQAQKHRFMGLSGMDVTRKESIERFGFDTKYAMHMLRLGIQGVEILTTGRLSVPMPGDQSDYLRSVRRGEVAKDAILERTGQLEGEIKALLDTSPLPEHPNVEAVYDWMQKTYWYTWSATYGHRLQMTWPRIDILGKDFEGNKFG